MLQSLSRLVTIFDLHPLLRRSNPANLVLLADLSSA